MGLIIIKFLCNNLAPVAFILLLNIAYTNMKFEVIIWALKGNGAESMVHEHATKKNELIETQTQNFKRTVSSHSYSYELARHKFI